MIHVCARNFLILLFMGSDYAFHAYGGVVFNSTRCLNVGQNVLKSKELQAYY